MASRSFVSRVLPCLSRNKPNAATTTTALSKTPAARNSSTSATTAKMSAPNALIELIKTRRTYYALNKELPIPKARIQEIVQEAVQHVPTSFNSQSNRAVILFDENHDKLWDITTATLKAIVPAESWEGTAGRMAGFKAGAATVLFFEDQDVVKGFQQNIPLYAENFPIWATQGGAMLQHTVWSALEIEGLGANLQHHNPLIDAEVAKTWNIPASWKLSSQLVIGGRAGEPGPKEFKPVEEKVKVFGA